VAQNIAGRESGLASVNQMILVQVLKNVIFQEIKLDNKPFLAPNP
jgi:hypothetical protein